MPRKYKKKNYKRGRKSNRIVSLNRQPIPSTALVKLRYCQTISINAAAAVSASRLFRANSMFDPGYGASSSDHQPCGYDQWMAFYTNYCVVGSRLTAQPINTGTVPLQFGVMLRQADPLPTTLTVDPSILQEQGDSSWAYCGAMIDGKIKSVSKNFSAKRFLGYSKPTDEVSLKATEGQNPAEQAFFQVWVAAADSTANPPATIFQITMEFIAVLSQPKNLLQS